MKNTFVLVLILCMASSLDLVSADGFIIPNPLPDVPAPPAFSIKYHHVNISIDNQYARTEVDQVFLNYFYRDLEGTYIFPLSERASISSFSMFAGGEKLEGELLEKDEAKRIYESIVRRLEDPAILEYMGRDMFRARVYPIPAAENNVPGEKRIALGYDELVSCDSGVCRYSYPLDTERFSARPIESILLSVSLTADKPIKSVYSPTHSVSVERISDFEVKVTYEETSAKPDRDFELFYTVSEDDFGLDVLTYRMEGDGFFLLLLAPSYDLGQEVIPKDIVFVIDSSGSMSGEKIKQARDALRFCVNNLNEDDRFNIVVFDSSVDSFRDSLVSLDSRDSALDFIDSIDSSGGTNINDALLSAISFMDDSPRKKVIVFLTDGLPTVGVSEPGEILKNAEKANGGEASLFVFGVGYDVNTHLLDSLSSSGSGVSTYVSPGEDIEVAVSSFYTKVQSPVLSGLELSFSGAGAKEIYPRKLPDLFKGSQLVVLGRYSSSGSAQVSLKGDVAGRDARFAYDVVFPEKEAENDFIPRLWATRKIGYLLDEIRLNGEDPELVDEVINLSLEYGIMTPYTSFLVDIDVPKQAPGQFIPTTTFIARDLLTQALDSVAFRASTGYEAVNSARETKNLKDSTVSGSGDERVKSIGSKTFYLRDGSWTDSDFSAENAVGLDYGSEDYFELAGKDPGIAKYLSLGKNVSFCFEGSCYEVGGVGGASNTTLPVSPPQDPPHPTDQGDNTLASTLLIVGFVIILSLGVLAFDRLKDGG